MNLDLTLVLASLAALFVGMSKGGLPAIGMMGVPLLSMVMPPMKAAVLLLPIYVISDMVSVWLYRRHFSAINLKILVPAGIFGVFVGWLTAAYTSDAVTKLLIGGMGIVFCLYTWFGQKNGPTQSANRLKGWFWGTVAGFTSFTSHAGAPPFQVYVLPQRLPKMVYAGTATLLFTCINAAKIWPYQLLNPYHADDLMQAALLVPAALIGTVVGAYATRKIADAWFFRFVQVSLFAVSVKLCADAAITW